MSTVMKAGIKEKKLLYSAGTETKGMANISRRGGEDTDLKIKKSGKKKQEGLARHSGEGFGCQN